MGSHSDIRKHLYTGVVEGKGEERELVAVEKQNCGGMQVRFAPLTRRHNTWRH